MYIGDIIERVNKYKMRHGNLDYLPAHIVIKELNKLSEECVRWSIDDFIATAKHLSGDEWELDFDKDLFHHALIQMIENHDASEGINWNTVTFYLVSMCKKMIPHNFNKKKGGSDKHVPKQ